MPLLSAQMAPYYLHSESSLPTLDAQTRLSPGAASHDGMFIPHPPPDTPAGVAPNPPRVRLSFNRRISDGAPTSDVDACERLPHVGLLAAPQPHGGGGSRRSVHPILSMRRRQTDFAGAGGMQVQIPQQSMSSPSQGGQLSQFRLALPSLASRTCDQYSPPSHPSDIDPALQSRLFGSLSYTPDKAQAPAQHMRPSIMQTPCKPKPLSGAPATPGYPPPKPAFMTQAPAVAEDSMFFATPVTTRIRRVLNSMPPPPRARPVSPTKVQPRQEQQQQQQPGVQLPAADSRGDDAEPHYELDAEFEVEAAKQRRMSGMCNPLYIKAPAGQEKGLDGGAAVPAEAEPRDEEDEEYEEEEKHWEPSEGLLLWLDANVGFMRKKGRVA